MLSIIQEAEFIILFLSSYLMGSISFAVIFSKLMKLPSPYTFGSKNPGATNVFRSGNKLAAILTFLGDFLKGFICVKFTIFFTGIYDQNSDIIMIVSFLVIIGHCFPIFHKFKGGKGVATSFGVIFAIYYHIAILMGLVWIIVYFFFRISGLASIISFLYLILFSMILIEDNKLIICFTTISIFLIFRHKKNIQKLIK